MHTSHLGPNTMLDGLEPFNQTFVEKKKSSIYDKMSEELRAEVEKRGAAIRQGQAELRDHAKIQESWQTEAVDAGSSLVRSLISTVTAPLTKSSDKPLVKQPPAQLPSDPVTNVATTNTQPVAKAALQPAPAPGPGMSQGMRTALMVGLLGGIGFLGYRVLAKPKKRGRRRKRR